jgi:phage virion morphogenesis protein
MAIDLTPDVKAALATLRGMMRKVQQPGPMYRRIAGALLTSTLLRFRDGVSPEGLPWRPLSAVTIARRRKGSNRILRDSGVLRGSITQAHDDRSATIGTETDYAPTHQFGAKKGSFGTTEASVRAHSRRVKSRDTRDGRKVSSRGVTFVRAHKRKMVIPWGDIPARPFLGVSADDLTEVKRIIEKSILGQ